MSATITTQPQHKVPLATALAVVGFVVAAGALGVAWEQSHDSTAPEQTPVLRTPTLQDYALYQHYYAQPKGVSTVPNAAILEAAPKPLTTVPNATIADPAPQGLTSQGQSTPNATIADPSPQGLTSAPNATISDRLQTFGIPKTGGHVESGQ